MPRVSFTANLMRHVECEAMQAGGATLRDVLEAAFAQNPALRSNILDEQGEIRTHIVVFIDGKPARDRRVLSDPVAASAEVYVMQALSGG